MKRDTGAARRESPGHKGSSLRRYTRSLRRNEDGFTLVEILFAFGLVAIAIAVGVVYLLGAQRNANNNAARQELSKISAAETTYLTAGQGQADSSYGTMAQLTADPAVKYKPGSAVKSVVINASGDTWSATVVSKTNGVTCTMTQDDQSPSCTGESN